MKNSKSLLEERAINVEKMEALVDLCKVEGRDMTSDELTSFDSLNEKVESLNSMVERSIKFENLQASKVVKEERTNSPKEVSEFSFQEAMRQAYTGKLEGLVKEMDQEARREHNGQMFRGIAIPSSVLEHRAVGNAAVNPTEVMSFTDQLEANLVLASAGANFYSGVSDMKLPVLSGISSAFVAETGGTATAAGTASSVTLSPKKMISIVEISAEAMAQNAGVEGAVRRNLAANIAATLEGALLADANVTSGPASIFAAAADQAVAGAAPTVAELLNMEATLIANGVNLEAARMAWLLDGGALTEAKSLAQVASVSPAYDNATKEFLSYFAFASSNVGNSAGTGTNYLLGDYSKVHIAQFGGLDLLFDPYTNAAAGIGRMIATSLVDGAAVQNSTAFVKIDNA
jgi:HK97 family phage major capsid protein